MAKKSKKSANIIMYVGIVAAVAVVGLVLWYMYRRPPSPPTPTQIPPGWATKQNSLDTKINKSLSASESIGGLTGGLKVNADGSVAIDVNGQIIFHNTSRGSDAKITLTNQGFLLWSGVRPGSQVVSYGQISPAFPTRDYVLSIADNGGLVLEDSMGYIRHNVQLYQNMLPITVPTQIPPSWANKQNSIDTIVNKVLGPGETVTSNDGLTILTMQVDGNFVLYYNGQAVQATGTNNSTYAGGSALFHDNGSIVVHSPGGVNESFLATDPLGTSQYVAWVDDKNLYIKSATGVIYVPIKINKL